MKLKYFLLFLLLISSYQSFACSCSPIKLMNAFSYADFIGVVQFESIKELNKNPGFYSSKIKIEELFKGNSNDAIFINSQKGSSCHFIPSNGVSFFILGFKNEQNLIEVSFCTALLSSSINHKDILRNISKKHKNKPIAYQFVQRLKGNINQTLFSKTKEPLIYKVTLNSDASISNIIPENKIAQQNFNSGIRFELLKKVSFTKPDAKLKYKKDQLVSYIILKWTKNLDNETILTFPNL
ncbi:exported protein of unknown function [Tenacibaculum jejuense]|uniref:Lipoprotein n=2 Tax=Tenacibaculum jejuense TaxID=584609 RepID=A0A238U6Z5_9FLAO|nr:exported protein of unknown function [Tenacibaculum jejuense]